MNHEKKPGNIGTSGNANGRAPLGPPEKRFRGGRRVSQKRRSKNMVIFTTEKGQRPGRLRLE